MTSTIDPVELASRIIACPSVTPARGKVFDVLEQVLRPLGFEIHRFVRGEVENMFATCGRDRGVHFGFAGHLDVVPPGDGWASDPFVPELRGGLLYGRGSVDMKGGIAAFVAACAGMSDHMGRISLLITGDEEGPALDGTRAI